MASPSPEVTLSFTLFFQGDCALNDLELGPTKQHEHRVRNHGTACTRARSSQLYGLHLRWIGTGNIYDYALCSRKLVQRHMPYDIMIAYLGG